MSLNTVWSEINPLTVVVAGIVHMLIGLIWFMPKLFGNVWVELTGKDMKPAPQWIAAGVVGHQVMALMLAVIVSLANATTVIGGVVVGFLVWTGFIVTLETGELIWEKIPFKLFMIRVSNQLVGLSLAGIILAVWR
jgi:hypothetical protein